MSRVLSEGQADSVAEAAGNTSDFETLPLHLFVAILSKEGWLKALQARFKLDESAFINYMQLQHKKLLDDLYPRTLSEKYHLDVCIDTLTLSKESAVITLFFSKVHFFLEQKKKLAGDQKQVRNLSHLLLLNEELEVKELPLNSMLPSQEKLWENRYALSKPEEEMLIPIVEKALPHFLNSAFIVYLRPLYLELITLFQVLSNRSFRALLIRLERVHKGDAFLQSAAIAQLSRLLPLLKMNVAVSPERVESLLEGRESIENLIEIMAEDLMKELQLPEN